MSRLIGIELGFADTNGNTVVSKTIYNTIIKELEAKADVANLTSLRIIINGLLEANAAEVRDDTSNIYKLFITLSKVNTYDAYEKFSLFFTSIDEGLFTISDILVYFDDNSYSINYENIVKFLDKVHEYKKEIIKSRLYTGIYTETGNLLSFFNKLYNDKTNTLFYRVTSSDMLLKNDNYFILDPNINYFGDNAEYYRNQRVAEEDYWNNMPAYAEIAKDNIALESIIQITTDKTYNNKANGLPVFLKKEYQKILFIENKDLNETMLAILKNSYVSLSDKEVLHYIDKMSGDFVEYYNDNPTFDYSVDSLELPDIAAFLAYKIAEVTTEHTGVENISLYELKEMTFYVLGILDFMNDDTYSTYETLRTDLIAEYVAIRATLISVWNELNTNGKYK